MVVVRYYISRRRRWVQVRAKINGQVRSLRMFSRCGWGLGGLTAFLEWLWGDVGPLRLVGNRGRLLRAGRSGR